MQMEILLNIVKHINLIKNYIASKKLMAIVAMYFVISIMLKIIFSIDILIPCIWKTLFHFNCPGCGLTTAFIKIMSLNIKDAYNANPLIFIILPLGLFLIYKDFLKFKKNNIQTLNS